MTGPGSDSLAFEKALAAIPHAIPAWTYALGVAEKAAADHMSSIFDQRGLPRPALMHPHVEDELRHSGILCGSVAAQRARLSGLPGYGRLERALVNRLKLWLVSLFSEVVRRESDPMQIYLYGAIPVESRVLDHYVRFSCVLASGVEAGAIRSVLKEEKQHAGMVRYALQKHLPGQEIEIAGKLESLFEVEARIWARMKDEVLTALAAYEPAHLARALA
jgi:hypothetical protein